jgi:hypothetical protein
MTKELKPVMGITRRSFQKWGAEGGKIGGAKNKKKGTKYFKKIGSLGGKAKSKSPLARSSKRAKDLGITKQWLSDQAKISKDINSISG